MTIVVYQLVKMARSQTNQFKLTTLKNGQTELIPRFTSLSLVGWFVRSHRRVVVLFTVWLSEW